MASFDRGGRLGSSTPAGGEVRSLALDGWVALGKIVGGGDGSTSSRRLACWGCSRGAAAFVRARSRGGAVVFRCRRPWYICSLRRHHGAARCYTTSTAILVAPESFVGVDEEAAL